LTLIRASKHRPSGQWSDNDYDVFYGDQHIARIMLHPQEPKGQPWFWSVTARVPQYPHDLGYAGASDGEFQGSVGATGITFRRCCLAHFRPKGREATAVPANAVAEITADCPTKLAGNLSDQCAARCPDLSRVM